MSEERLRPAKVERGGGSSSYGPRLPWKWIVPILAVVILGGGGYWVRQRKKAEQLREGILTAYAEQIGPLAKRVRRFRDELEAKIMTAKKDAPADDYVDPRLRLSGLHDAQGLYLRLLADDATDPEAIAEGAAKMDRDAITRCLGLSPISLRGLYERGDFLMEDWVDQVRTADSVMRLRVLQDELQKHIDRDLPMLATLLGSDYFLLVLQQGESRRDEPVDVYLWDLRRDEKLLETRAKAKGLLLPVRIRVGDAPRSATKPSLRSGGANDCSIAAQVKELAGEPAVGIGDASAKKLEEAERRAATPEDAGTGPNGGAAQAASASAGGGSDASSGAKPPASGSAPPNAIAPEEPGAGAD
jgi:hypothetical protein